MNVSLDDNFFGLKTRPEREAWLSKYAVREMTNLYPDMFPNVQELVHIKEEIDTIDLDIKRLQDKKKELKEKSKSISAPLLKIPDYNDFLYWVFPTLTGAKSHNVSTISVSYTQLCGACKETETKELIIKSWANLKNEAAANGNIGRMMNCKCTELRNAKWEARQQARQERLELLNTMPYKEYLQTDEWKATRLRILKRAGFQCELCTNSLQLQVHHKTYERRGNELDTDLIVLCQNCHKTFHGKI